MAAITATAESTAATITNTFDFVSIANRVDFRQLASIFNLDSRLRSFVPAFNSTCGSAGFDLAG